MWIEINRNICINLDACTGSEISRKGRYIILYFKDDLSHIERYDDDDLFKEEEKLIKHFNCLLGHDRTMIISPRFFQLLLKDKICKG